MSRFHLFDFLCAMNQSKQRSAQMARKGGFEVIDRQRCYAAKGKLTSLTRHFSTHGTNLPANVDKPPNIPRHPKSKDLI